MQKVLQRMGKAILKIACLIGVGLLQFLYNITYITGAQTLRILKRLEKRMDRFLYPLRDLCHRIYLRFFRRKLRMAHYSRVKIRSNLRWESDNLQAVRQKHGIRSAISHFWQARQHRAILSAVGHVVFPLVALLVLGGTIWFWNQQTYGLYLSYGEGESAVVADEGVFDEASEMMNQRMMFETATATEINTVASYRLGIMEETQFTDASVICDNLIRSSDDVISDACGVYINGELGGVVRSSTDLRYVLETLLREEKEKSEALSADYLVHQHSRMAFLAHFVKYREFLRSDRIELHKRLLFIERQFRQAEAHRYPHAALSVGRACESVYHRNRSDVVDAVDVMLKAAAGPALPQRAYRDPAASAEWKNSCPVQSC